MATNMRQFALKHKHLKYDWSTSNLQLEKIVPLGLGPVFGAAFVDTTLNT